MIADLITSSILCIYQELLMASLLVDKRDIEFLLYEQFEILKLTEKPLFSHLSKSEFDMVLEQGLRFAENELAPVNQDGDRIGAKWDNGKVTVPPSFHRPIKLFAEQGWVSCADDLEAGGQGLPMALFTAVNEMFHAANTALNLYTGLVHGAGKLIELFGTDSQKERYLERLYTYQWSGSMCLTEPGAGSDLAQITTKAVKMPDGRYKISGQKIFITAGDHDLTDNIIHPVLARIEGDPEGIRGISIFIVPKYRLDEKGETGEFNDVVCAGIEHKMGIKGSATCQLSFGDNGDCIGELLGNPGQGIMIMFHMMNEERLNVGVQSLALSSTSYLHALKYARERLQGTDIRQKGQSTKLMPIIGHPDIRRGLLWMKSYIEGIRALNYYTALCIDLRNAEEDEALKKAAGVLVEFLTPVCKAYSSDMAWRICSEAIQVFGGYGYCGDYPVEQFARDTKITSLYEGTNGIQAIDLLHRKMSMDKGRAFAYLISRIEETISDASKDSELVSLAETVRKAKDVLLETADHFKSMIGDGKIPEAFTNAVPFLDIMGDTILGWMHLWQVTIARKKLESLFTSKGAGTPQEQSTVISENAEAAFYSGKIHSARFFINKILPIQEGKAVALRNDDISPLEIQDLAFGQEHKQ
ncbi:MAG: acyl-CoA dehydrogenase [Spirochaetae bacterium HGW-Spirochaetae-1]|nr:MAG: acyl-CoA dehydrogenase [Spirochaetae bacterium HGW-Spirochaetae-1]